MILYACVASKGEILAEYDSGENLSSVASQCVLAAPKYHRYYTHTAQELTYAFLFDRGDKCEQVLVFFAISKEHSEVISFLERLSSAYRSKNGGGDFSQTVVCLTGNGKPHLPLPPALGMRELRLRKWDDDDGCGEHELEIIDCGENHGNGEATREVKWRRQVRVALMLDLFLCSAMFVVWLSVCRGFECIRSL